MKKVYNTPSIYIHKLEIKCMLENASMKVSSDATEGSDGWGEAQGRSRNLHFVGND